MRLFMFKCFLIEYNIRIQGELGPASEGEKDVLVFVKSQANTPYLRIPGSDIADVKRHGFFKRKMTVTTRSGVEHHFEGQLSRIHSIIQFIMASNSQDAELLLDLPEEAVTGETFDLTVKIRNRCLEKNIEIKSISIADNYLSGFKVISVNPPAGSRYHIDGISPDLTASTCFALDSAIPGNQAMCYVFNLSAEKEGSFSGDISAIGESIFLSAKANMVVHSVQAEL